jgi:hypothetical protein
MVCFSTSQNFAIENCLVDFSRAEVQFERIRALDPYRIDDIDIYSNILYVTDNKLKLSRLAHEFLGLDKDRPEICCLVGPFCLLLTCLNPFILNSRKSLLAASGTRKGGEVFPAGYTARSDIFIRVDPDGS